MIVIQNQLLLLRLSKGRRNQKMAWLEDMVLNVMNDLKWILLYLYVLAALWIVCGVMIVSGCFRIYVPSL